MKYPFWQNVQKIMRRLNALPPEYNYSKVFYNPKEGSVFYSMASFNHEVVILIEEIGKSHGAISGQYGVCGTPFTWFMMTHWRIMMVVWDGALSGWKNNELFCPNYGSFYDLPK